MKKGEITMIYSYLRDTFENRGYMNRFSVTTDLFEYNGKLNYAITEDDCVFSAW